MENRLRIIRRNVNSKKWNHCRSGENPSDIITRFNSCNLNNNETWWHGPAFLTSVIEPTLLNQRGNPITSNTCHLEKGDMSHAEYNVNLFKKETHDELKSKEGITLIVKNNKPHRINQTIDMEKYSDLNKLYRITALVLRFIVNTKKKEKMERLLHTYVTLEELRKAKTKWIKENQVHLREYERYDELMNKLKLYEDDDNIIRSQGRLKYADLPYKDPIMLHRDHKLATLIVENCHRIVLHREKQTLTELRARYWIVRGKSFVRKTLHSCIICKKLNGRPYKYPDQPALPRERVDDEFPFKSCGVDHIGPVYVKDVYDVNEEDNINRAHAVLYTCATSRGIILDLVKDTSASCFVNSCIKFISRGGCPQVFLSDNGPAFKCRETQEFAALRNIEWKFSIAEAPNFGWFWERLVACVKNCLKKTIGRASLRFDELQAILNEIGLTLNSRPLVPIYDDTTEEAITPNHLLFGGSLNAINNETHPNICTKELNKRYTYLEKLLKHFWERWTTGHHYVNSKNTIKTGIDRIFLE